MGFDDFLAVTNILHIHMKKNAVMQTEFTILMNKMEELCTKTMTLSEKTKKVADSAGSTANKKTGKG